MAGGGGKFEEVKEAVGADVKDYRAGGSGPPDLMKFLQCEGSSNPTVWHRVLVDVPSDQEDLRKVPPQGRPLAGKYAAKEDRGG